jgi:hypothetical protein
LIGLGGSLLAAAAVEPATNNLVCDILRGFEEMRREMERQFEEQFENFQSTVPEDLIREYEISKGG